jgi:peptidoglycan/LPS O-acetylase OafA/YrhL
MSVIHNQAIAYRREIDGLRAVAVLPVILFHTGCAYVTGGFVGVDVFFVISGYLITAILIREIDEGNFSIARFYERRARRLLPALVVVIACCLPFAWIWMLPGELKRFGQTLAAVATSSSNIYFWKNTDYFSPAAEEQPLLHTWSLAVEEQYYMLFPLFLIFAWRIGKQKLFWLIALIAALSLVLAECSLRALPVAAFYLLPTRAWELLAGSLLAFIPIQRAAALRRGIIAEAGSFVGLALIFVSIFAFDKTMPWPSFYTMVPVLGTVLTLTFASSSNFAGRVLSTRAFVGIGLISYSAYLWHQPILAFGRIRLLNVTYPEAIVVASVVLSLVLATLSWRFVETPFRLKKSSTSNVLRVSMLALVGCLSFGMAFSVSGGITSRVPTSFTQFADHYENYDRDWQDGRCFIHSAYNDIRAFAPECYKRQVDGEVILLGDSHAAALYPGLKAAFGAAKISNLTMSGCKPTFALSDGTVQRCKTLNPQRWQYVEQNPKAQLVISANWSADDVTPGHLEYTQLTNTLERELRFRDKTSITLVGCVPEWDPHLPLYLVRMSSGALGFYGKTGISQDEFALLERNRDREARKLCNQKLQAIASKFEIRFIDAWTPFCNERGECKIRLSAAESAANKLYRAPELTTFDYGHLTKAASEYFVRTWASQLANNEMHASVVP